jgi:hypothetical protein
LKLAPQPRAHQISRADHQQKAGTPSRSHIAFSVVVLPYPDSPTPEVAYSDRAKVCGVADSSFRPKNADAFFNLRPGMIRWQR